MVRTRTNFTHINTFIYIKTAVGNTYGFGGNNKGQLGVGDFKDRYSPCLIPHIDCAASVSCGSFHSGVVTTVGELRLWGWGKHGQLVNCGDFHIYTHTLSLSLSLSFSCVFEYVFLMCAMMMLLYSLSLSVIQLKSMCGVCVLQISYTHTHTHTHT